MLSKPFFRDILYNFVVALYVFPLKIFKPCEIETCLSELISICDGFVLFAFVEDSSLTKSDMIIHDNMIDP